MKRLICPLVIALGSGSAWAENVNVYVPRDGGGVTQKPGNVTPQEAAILMGDTAPPENVTGIILENGEEPRWTDLPPEEVDREYDGDGDPEVELLPEDDPTPPLPLPEGKEPIELFPEDETANARIRPNAGNWVGVVRDQTMEGCDGGMGQALAAQTAALNASAIDGKIDADFNPNVAAPALDWAVTGPNSWLADFSPPSGGQFNIRMQWAMTIKTPDLIANTQQIDMLTCKVVSKIDYVRQ